MFKIMSNILKRPEHLRSHSKLFQEANKFAEMGEKKKAVDLINIILKEDPGCKAALAKKVVLEKEIQPSNINHKNPSMNP